MFYETDDKTIKDSQYYVPGFYRISYETSTSSTTEYYEFLSDDYFTYAEMIEYIKKYCIKKHSASLDIRKLKMIDSLKPNYFKIRPTVKGREI